MPSRFNPLRFLTQGSPANPPSGYVAAWMSNDTVPRMKTRTSSGVEKYVPYELVFNVRDYGALGNGTADDAPAIQAALNAANAAGGGTVSIPAGTYKINSELEIPGNYINIRADYRATIKRGSSSMQYMLKNFNPSYAPTGYAGRSHLRLEGGVWDADGANLTTACTVIVFAHGAYIRVSDIVVINTPDWHGLELNACFGVIVENCAFLGFNLVTAGRDMSEAIQLDLATSSAALPGIGAGAYDNTPCYDILVTGCSVRGFGTLGSFGKLIGSHNARDGLPSQNIRVTNCFAENCNDYGVAAYNWQNVVVSENQFVNCNGGVLIELPTGLTQDIERFTIANNQFIGSGTINNGAALEDSVLETRATGTGVIRSVSFNNNNIKNFANSIGIALETTSDAVIQGNTVRNGTHASSAGIQITDSAFGAYCSNKIDSVAVAGIIIRNSSGDSSLVGNCINSSSDGIQIQSARIACVGNVMRITNLGNYGIRVTSAGLGSVLTGNIIYNSATGTATVAGIYIEAGISIGIQGNMIIGHGTTEGTAGTIRRGGTLNPNMVTTQGTQNVNVYTDS